MLPLPIAFVHLTAGISSGLATERSHARGTSFTVQSCPPHAP
jgi:hypothetical protein